MTLTPARPLAGTTVLDVSRMIPGAVASRMLLDLGARVIKVEAPAIGDPMRWAPPLVDGIGAGFRAFYRGAESICLDLRQPRNAETLGALAGHADVLLESFRPGTLEGWGAGPETLVSRHPALIVCSLSSFGRRGGDAGKVAHDLNVTAASGLLSLLPGEGVPRAQFADVGAGLLAASAVLAMLLARAGTGRGGWIDQPLSTGALPFLTLALAEASAGGGGMTETILAGACPAYRLYRCADGLRVAVAALEPKFWSRLLELLELPELESLGLDCGTEGARAATRVQDLLSTRPREHWLALVEGRGLPVAPVHDATAAGDALRHSSSMEETPAGVGRTIRAPGPYLPSVGTTPARGAPALGEHTASVLAEFGVGADREES